MPSGKTFSRMWMVAVAGAALTGCGGEGAEETTVGGAPTDDTTAVAVTPAPGAPATTPPPGAAPAPGTTPGATPAPGASAPAPGGAAPAATPPAGGGGGGNVAAGQTLYAGQGICFTCHGPGGVGTALAPNLTDAQWLWFPSKPSEAQLVTLIKTGVSQPKQHPAPMPPAGGGTMSDQQLRDLAAYVRSLSPG